jgi:hypothetical protein
MTFYFTYTHFYFKHRAASYLLIGGLSLLLGCWSRSPLKNGVVSGMIGGLFVGIREVMGLGWIDTPLWLFIDVVFTGLVVGILAGGGIGSLSRIESVEVMGWNWSGFLKKSIPGALIGLIAGALAVAVDFSGRPLTIWLLTAVCYALAGALFGGIIGGLDGKVSEEKTRPNQGIILSLKNATTAVVLGLLVGGSLVGLILLPRAIALGSSLSGIVGDFNDVAPIVVPVAALILGLSRGGCAVIKHYSLRLILSLNGYTPYRLSELLDYCAKLILLKQVGGGYIFMHRMLLEYYSERYCQVNKRTQKHSIIWK